MKTMANELCTVRTVWCKLYKLKLMGVVHSFLDARDHA